MAIRIIIHRLIFFTAVLLLFSSCNIENKNKTLVEKLNDIPGITITKVENLLGFSECFQIDLTQPVDHNDPDNASFKQRFFLSHRGENSPTVFYTTGYGASRNSERDLTSAIQGNQILLVHRYFPNAIPSADWQFLTIWQAASDQHRIKELFKKIYTGKWVSSGGSKGGMTALFYRYYFPDDMDATVAYVAPIMSSTDDLRFEKFLQEVGSEDCREKIKTFQHAVLTKRKQIMPLLETHIQNNGYEFSIISKEAAFEYSVMEFMFAFWQYGSENECSSIPSTESELNDEVHLFNYLIQISPVSFYADNGFNYYKPLFYQAYTEIGYCTFVYSHLEDLLETVKNPTYRSFAPQGVEMFFNPDILQNIIPWLQHNGERILYLYGGIDPWTAGAIDPDPDLDSLMIIQPGSNHRIRINELDEKDLVIQTLNRWLDISINLKNLKTTKYNNRKALLF